MNRGFSIIPIPFPHRGWHPSYSLIPPAAIGYRDSDTNFLPRLTLTQSPSHGKNNPVEIHAQSLSSVEDIHFLRYSKGFLAMAYSLHGLWSSCLPRRGSLAPSYRQGMLSLLETQNGRRRNATAKGPEWGIQLHNALGRHSLGGQESGLLVTTPSTVMHPLERLFELELKWTCPGTGISHQHFATPPIL